MVRYQPVIPDKDAEYQQEYQLNIDQLIPQVALQGSASQAKPVAELSDLPVQQIIIGSCTAGRFEDLRVTAEILKGKQVHENCRLQVIPGSRAVYLEALKKGLIRVFIEAGAMVEHPGCRPGMPDSTDLIADGERCLSTTHVSAGQSDSTTKCEIYTCSPATAAASALNGALTDPTRYGR